jgi:hypothetical protein
VASLRDGKSLPFPSANALIEIGEALALVGEEGWAERNATLASSLASAHHFHQLTYRLENPVHVRVPEPAPVSESTSAIIAALDELEGAELVGATL